MSVQFLPPRPNHFRLPIADFQLASCFGYQSAIGNQKSAMFLRDGVAGNTSGFELEDEGSTPSPAANLSNAIQRYFDYLHRKGFLFGGNENEASRSTNSTR